MFCKLPNKFFIIFLYSNLNSAIYCLNEFKCLSESPYYIDKTHFLSTLFYDIKMPFNFITCPRRFGKTATLEMIENFAQIEIDKHRHPIDWTKSKSLKIFKNLNVAEIKSLMGNHFARYPVIQLNLGLKNIKYFNSTDLLSHLNDQLEKCFDKFRWLCKCRYHGNFSVPFGSYSNITQDEYDFVKSALNKTMNNTGISNSLLELSRILHDYFRSTQVIVLVDDYDSAAINAMLAPCFNLSEYYNLVNSMLSQVFLNGQKYVKFALITATSAINFYQDRATCFATVAHRPFLSNHQFTPFCGFIENEVQAKCKKLGISKTDRSDIQNYYNGYLTASVSDPKHIYNPFAFTRYLMLERKLKKYSLPSQQADIIPKFLNFREFRQNLFKPAWSKTTDRCNFTLTKIYEKDDLDKLLFLLRKNHNYLTLEQIQQDKHDYLRILHSFAFEQGYFAYCFGIKNHFKIPNQQIKLEVKEMMTKFFKAPPDHEF